MRLSHRQQGAALLLLLFVTLTVTASLVVLRSNATAVERESTAAATRAALVAARQALIAYAVNTPALTPARLGPGRLPCPSANDSGTPRGSCSLAGGTMTGRLPYRELGVGPLTDGSGTLLWYALDEGFRYHLDDRAINSDTPSTLAVDDATDVVAVIIAPGAPLPGQVRRAAADAAAFLEGANAATGEVRFTHGAMSATFNDVVLPLSRGDLMRAVERRVLAETRKALLAWRAVYGGFPWASPFTDPSLASYAPAPQTRAGLLPLHVSGPGAASVFATAFTAKWRIPTAGSVTGEPGPTTDCLRMSACADPDAGAPAAAGPLPFSDGRCVWHDAETFACTGTHRIKYTRATGAFARVYKLDFFVPDQWPILVPPTTDTPRQRGFDIRSGALPSGARIVITVSDTVDGVAQGSRTLVVHGGDPVERLSVRGVVFFPGDDRDAVTHVAHSPGALPRWFTRNEWHHFVHFAFARSERANGVGCIAANDCLRIHRHGPQMQSSVTHAPGLVMMAGPALKGAPARPAGESAAYFEGDNAIFDDRYTRAARSATRNDQLRVLQPHG